jgi:hypothetical protein
VTPLLRGLVDGSLIMGLVAVTPQGFQMAAFVLGCLVVVVGIQGPLLRK